LRNFAPKITKSLDENAVFCHPTDAYRDMRFLLACLALLIGCVSTYSQSNRYTLRLCWFPQAQFTGYIVAEREGYYEAEGLNLQVSSFVMGEDLFEILTNKQVDFVIGTFLEGLHYYHDGKKVANIFQCTQKSSELLVALKKSRIHSYADLCGRTIGFWPSEVFHISYRTLLEKNGVTGYHAYRMPSNVDLLLYGGVDAMMAMTFNEYQQILFAGYKPEEVTVFRMDDTFPGLVFDGVYVREEFWKERPDLIEAFRKASIKGWKKSFEDPRWALKILQDACDEHNKNNPERYAAFNIAAQKRMFEEMRQLIVLEGNSCILKKQTFQIGMQILEYPEQDIRYEDFMPIYNAEPVWTGLEKKVEVFNAD